jgi:NADP-dependent 3-hydroxy acid dehydrogenase YdfG
LEDNLYRKQKAIWITGAGSGIGRELTLEFIKNGFTVLGTSRKYEVLNSLKNSLGEKQDSFHISKLDVSDDKLVAGFYETANDKYDIDCLINNAGITSFSKAEDDSIELIKKIIDVNLLGGIYTIKSALKGMIDRNSGTIINILSVATQKVFTLSSAYSASKSGLLAYTNVLREEIRDKNIRVINISPGPTETPIWPERTINKFPGKMMNASDLAKLVYYLYSEKSNLVAENVVVRPITGDL